MSARLVLCLLLLAALPATARAQRPDSAPSVIPVREALWRRPWVRPLASLVVPGSGQLLGGRDRGMVYLAAEVWFVARALAFSGQGRRERDQFVTLGFDVARAQFTPYRLDAPWEPRFSMPICNVPCRSSFLPAGTSCETVDTSVRCP